MFSSVRVRRVSCRIAVKFADGVRRIELLRKKKRLEVRKMINSIIYNIITY